MGIDTIPARQRMTLLILGGWCLTATLITISWLLFTQLLRPAAIPSSILIPSAMAQLAPEPIERAAFLTGLILTPPCLLLTGIWLGKRPKGQRTSPWGWDRLDAGLSILIGAAILWPLPASFAIRAVSGADARFTAQASLIHSIVAGGLSLIIVLATTRQTRTPRALSKRLTHLVTVLSVAIATLFIGAGMLIFRVFKFQHLSGSPVWSDHLDAVVASIAQVQAGKTLLIDTPSQYGLFPELLSPILSFFPAGIQSLTLSFAALQWIGMLCVMAVLRRRIRNPAVLTTALLALAMVTFGLFSVIGISFGDEPDPYFQYWPVRFIGPALSIPLTFWVFRRLCWPRLMTASALTGLCLFWNLDSGAAVLYAQGMLLLLLTMLKAAGGTREDRSWRSLAAATVLTPLASLIWLAVFLSLLSLKAGEPLQLAWLTGFQSTFYGLGFMMLPLPSWPDAWHCLIGVYLIGLTIALAELRDGRALGQQLPLLYLSLLGAGLFTYFQGRSHYLNLVGVSWPGVMVAALLTDRHLLAIRHRLAPISTIALPISGLTALMIPAAALVMGTPILRQRLSHLPINQPEPTALPAPYLHSELAMVHQFCAKPKPPCLILSKRQGIYALEARTATDWKGPSPAEMLLESDHRALIKAISNGQPQSILLGIGPNSRLPNLRLSPSDLLRHYKPAAINHEGTMVWFLRQTAAQPSP